MSAAAQKPSFSFDRHSVDALVARHRSGEISRREFFQKLAFLTGSLLFAHQLMMEEGLAFPWEAYTWPGQQGQAPAPTPKESIEAGEKRLPPAVQAEWVKYKSGETEMGGYLARPKSGAPFAAILVIHENRGLTEFVLDIAQRWASEGLLALAPDCLSRLGGTPKYESMQAASEGIRQLQRPDVTADLLASLAFLKSRSDVRRNKLGVTGFCWGGGYTFHLATESQDLAFAMPFYGISPAADALARVSCPVLGIYAESDTRINAGLDDVEAKMKELGKSYTRRVFPGTQHAFMNFTAPGRYHADAALAAWAEAVAFVKKSIS